MQWLHALKLHPHPHQNNRTTSSAQFSSLHTSNRNGHIIYQEAIEAIKAGEFNDAIMATKATNRKRSETGRLQQTMVANEEKDTDTEADEEAEAA